MSGKQPPIINIAIVGGESYSSEIIEKTTLGFSSGDVNNRIKAIADINPSSPGMKLAKRLGLITLDDYHKLYDPKYDIHLIIILLMLYEYFLFVLCSPSAEYGTKNSFSMNHHGKIIH